MPRVVQNPTDSIMPSVKCHIHPNNVYELYCESHDEVMCVACKSVDHSKCGVENIQSMAKGQNDAQLKQYSLGTMSVLWKNLDKMKNEIKTDIEREDEALSNALDKIEYFKRAEIAKIERLAEQSVSQVKLHDEKIRQKIQQDMKSTEDKQREVDSFQIQVSDNITENKCDLFIFDKLTSKTKTSIDDFAGCLKMGCIDFVSVNVPSSETISSPQVSHVPYQLNFMQNIDIVDAKSGCDLRDMCILDNGQVVITDFDNKCLYRLDCLYKIYSGACKVIERCTVNGEPWGVCELSPDKVAVTLCVQKKVCLIMVGSSMQVTKEFDVGEQCRGISFKDGFLYVGCWAKKEVPGEVKVFDLNGRFCKSLKDVYHFVTHLCVSSDSERLYVSDLSDGKNAGKGLTILDSKSGEQQKVTNASELVSTFCVGNGELDEIVVGDRDNKVVYRIDKYGKIIQKFKNEILVANPPQSVQYYRKHIVMSSRKSAKLLVFLLSGGVGKL